MAANEASRKYPEELRVLVVDTSTKKLVKFLEKCHYQVWRSESAAEALQMLGEKNEIPHFEVVMCDVKIGFDFVDHVANKLGVPLILMSKDGGRNKVIEGIERGACAYLRKPIRLKDVQCIWQHDYRNKLRRQRGKNKREVVESSKGGGGDDSCSGVKKPRF